MTKEGGTTCISHFIWYHLARTTNRYAFGVMCGSHDCCCTIVGIACKKAPFRAGRRIHTYLNDCACKRRRKILSSILIDFSGTDVYKHSMLFMVHTVFGMHFGHHLRSRLTV